MICLRFRSRPTYGEQYGPTGHRGTQMGIRLRKVMAGLCGSAAVVFVLVIAAEVATRILVSEPTWRFALLFFSQGAVKDAPWGGHRYEPNATVQVRLFNITDLNGPRLAKI